MEVNPQKSSQCFLQFPVHNFGTLGVDATMSASKPATAGLMCGNTSSGPNFYL